MVGREATSGNFWSGFVPCSGCHPKPLPKTMAMGSQRINQANRKIIIFIKAAMSIVN